MSPKEADASVKRVCGVEEWSANGIAIAALHNVGNRRSHVPIGLSNRMRRRYGRNERGALLTKRTGNDPEASLLSSNWCNLCLFEYVGLDIRRRLGEILGEQAQTNHGRIFRILKPEN